MWHSEDEDAQLDTLRKKAVKVKHVKRREKKTEKKVRTLLTRPLMMSLMTSLTLLSSVEVCHCAERRGEASSSQSEAASQGARAAQRKRRRGWGQGGGRDSEAVSGSRMCPTGEG